MATTEPQHSGLHKRWLERKLELEVGKVQAKLMSKGISVPLPDAATVESSLRHAQAHLPKFCLELYGRNPNGTVKAQPERPPSSGSPVLGSVVAKLDRLLNPAVLTPIPDGIAASHGLPLSGYASGEASAVFGASPLVWPGSPSGGGGVQLWQDGAGSGGDGSPTGGPAGRPSVYSPAAAHTSRPGAPADSASAQASWAAGPAQWLPSQHTHPHQHLHVRSQPGAGAPVQRPPGPVESGTMLLWNDGQVSIGAAGGGTWPAAGSGAGTGGGSSGGGYGGAAAGAGLRAPRSPPGQGSSGPIRPDLQGADARIDDAMELVRRVALETSEMTHRERVLFLARQANPNFRLPLSRAPLHHTSSTSSAPGAGAGPGAADSSPLRQRQREMLRRGATTTAARRTTSFEPGQQHPQGTALQEANGGPRRSVGSVGGGAGGTGSGDAQEGSLPPLAATRSRSFGRSLGHDAAAAAAAATVQPSPSPTWEDPGAAAAMSRGPTSPGAVSFGAEALPSLGYPSSPERRATGDAAAAAAAAAAGVTPGMLAAAAAAVGAGHHDSGGRGGPPSLPPLPLGSIQSLLSGSAHGAVHGGTGAGSGGSSGGAKPATMVTLWGAAAVAKAAEDEAAEAARREAEAARWEAEAAAAAVALAEAAEDANSRSAEAAAVAAEMAAEAAETAAEAAGAAAAAAGAAAMAAAAAVRVGMYELESAGVGEPPEEGLAGKGMPDVTGMGLSGARSADRSPIAAAAAVGHAGLSSEGHRGVSSGGGGGGGGGGQRGLTPSGEQRMDMHGPQQHQHQLPGEQQDPIRSGSGGAGPAGHAAHKWTP